MVPRNDAVGTVAPYTGRCVLPPPGNQPAVIVPMDYPEIVPLEKPHEPYPALEHLFEQGLESLRELAARLTPYFDLKDVTDERVNDHAPYWRNPYFAPMDGRVLYAMTRLFKPQRVIEIGSGNSTKFLKKAVTEGHLNTKISSIDPSPRTSISQLVDEVIPMSVVDCGPAMFSELQENDFLFLDGSHLAIHGTDVPHFFLRILPAVNPGVIVHIHDIYLPDEYVPACDMLHYGEQYVLGAFLLGNNEWRTLVPVHFAYKLGIFSLDGVSFWMTRVA